MKIVARKVLAMILMLLGALAMTKAFYEWPDLLPNGIKTWGNAIVEAIGSPSIEASSDIEMAYLFFVSLLMLSVIFATLNAVWIWFNRQT